MRISLKFSQVWKILIKDGNLELLAGRQSTPVFHIEPLTYKDGVAGGGAGATL